jgi:hypothetical protein
MSNVFVRFSDVGNHDVWVNPAAVRYAIQYDRTSNQTTLQFAKDDVLIVTGAAEEVAKKLGTGR